MALSQLNLENVSVRLAASEEEVRASQRLRYRVFYEEYKAKPNEDMARERRDFDEFDKITDHLIVVDESQDNIEDRIVGTYRLLRREIADKHGRFYTSDEYDIAPLLKGDTSLLELGRSCVLAGYRTRPVLQLLWRGIIDYSLDNDIDLMFGCASLHGTDIPALSQQLAYLYHYHLAPKDLCPRAVDSRFIDMNQHPKEEINVREQFASLPPLIKGYLRVGASIGDGAVIDHQFNTTDVCIVFETKKMTARYRNHYARKLSRALPDSETQDTAEEETFDTSQAAVGSSGA